MTGKYVWKLIFDFDNSGHTAPIEYTYALTQSGLYTSMMFNEFLAKEAKTLVTLGKLQTDTSYRPLTVSFMDGHKMSKEVCSFLQNMTMDQQEEIVSYSRMEVRKCMVGSNTRMVLYQRVFEAPGMTVHEGITKMMPAPLTQDKMIEEIPMQMTLTAMKFIKGLKVVYSDDLLDAPIDRVRDYFGGSDDMNYMYDGKFVWIVPIMTTKVSEALTRFDTLITHNASPNHDDLAKGDGGSYRYLLPVKETHSNMFMTELTLARFASDVHLMLPLMFYPHLPKGFTGDINMGRGSGYMYLAYKMQRAFTV
ncbi:hypothetical protein C0993_009743 [Termitomyces sp. T159_Od127]|nr:hypothetical protein C0993_009743 [Termitomyces sp. T159_Od127]